MYGIWDLFCCWFLVLLHYCTVKKNGLQHTRLPCPSQSSGICSNSCSLSQWGHPTISSSVVPFSTCPQTFPASGSFRMSQFFVSGGWSIGVSASASVLPVNTQDRSPLEWTGCISFLSPRDSQESSLTPQFKSINSLVLSFLYSPTLTSIHDYWKNIYQTPDLLAPWSWICPEL